MTTSPKSDHNGLLVSWGGLSLGLSVVAIASLGTLAVIAKKQSADSLSTIALALAILSFAAQLIVALAQAYNGTVQLSQADRVNADTRSSLAEIRATSNALLSNQREQFSEVLRAALNVAVPAAVEDVTPSDDGDSASEHIDSSTKDLEERLFVRLNEELARPGSSATPGSTPTVTRAPLPIYDQLTTYPDEKPGKEALVALNRLSSRDAAMFGRNAFNIRDRARAGRSPSIVITRDKDQPGLVGATKRMVDAGLMSATELEPNPAGNTRYRLTFTDLGTVAASLFLSSPPIPKWLKAEYPEVK